MQPHGGGLHTGRQLSQKAYANLRGLSFADSNIEFYVSGAVSIFVFGLLCICFMEHQTKSRYPQNVITALLALGTAFRSIWWFADTVYYTEMGVWAINRFALLCQFSALSYLLLMWMRSMLIFVEDKVRPSSLVRQSSLESMYKQQTVLALRQQSQEVKDLTKMYYRTTLFINAVFWSIIIITIPFMTGDSNAALVIYDFNILSIALANLILALLFCIISVRLTLRVFHKLCVSTERVGHPNFFDSVGSCLNSIPLTWRIVNFDEKDPNLDTQEKNQRKVLRSIMRVSVMLIILFLIRFFGFLIRPVFLEYGETEDVTLSYVYYPWFFYFFPEIIPALIVCLTIAPPQGILRKLHDKVLKFCCCCCYTPESANSNEIELANGRPSSARIYLSESSGRASQSQVGSEHALGDAAFGEDITSNGVDLNEIDDPILEILQGNTLSLKNRYVDQDVTNEVFIRASASLQRPDIPVQKPAAIKAIVRSPSS